MSVSKRNLAISAVGVVLVAGGLALFASRGDEDAPGTPPAPSASEERPVREPVDEVFRFNAAVKKADGTLPVGLNTTSRCEVRVVARDEVIRGLRVYCEGTSIYDDVDSGAAGDLRSELRELPAPGSKPEEPAWVYEVSYSRHYEEKTPMHTVPQIELDTAKQKLRVFSAHEPRYSIEAELVETQVGFRRGEGLLPEHR